jgi:hypothetical protein
MLKLISLKEPDNEDATCVFKVVRTHYMAEKGELLSRVITLETSTKKNRSKSKDK